MLIKFNTGRSGTADNLASHDKHSRSVCHMIEVSKADAFLVLRTNSGFLVHEGEIDESKTYLFDPNIEVRAGECHMEKFLKNCPEKGIILPAKEEKSDEKTTDEASKETIQKEERRDERKRNTPRTKRRFSKSAS